MASYKKISQNALDTGLKAIENSFGGQFAEGGLMDTEYKAIPTGHDDLDYVLTRGEGGIFLGGVCELYGGEGSGKTSVAMRTVGMAQKLGLHCAWLDAEHSFSPDLAELNQCEIDKLVMLSMTKGEGNKVALLNAAEVLHKVFEAVWSNLFSIVVVDSVAALMPERIVSESFDGTSKGMGELARDLSSQLPKISAACKEKECTVIFINQIREKIGVMFGDPKTTPGGRALKFFASQRISIEKMGGEKSLIKQKDEEGIDHVAGHYAIVRVKKNRRNKPCYDRLEIPIYYEEYFPDDAKKCYDIARKLQVIKPRKDTMTWKDGDTVVATTEGEGSMLEWVRDDRVSHLAHCCVRAAKGDRNLKLKVPITISSAISKLADVYDPQKPIKKKPGKATLKTDMGDELDLND